MTEPISETEFERVADETLNRMVDALADAELDGLDADLESGVLSIVFEDGTKYVVNSHRAARQIWLAAGANAWHFDRVGSEWRSTRSDDELLELVERLVSDKVGSHVALR